MFDSSDSMYKLISLILSDFVTQSGASGLSKYISDLKLEKIIVDKREKIEEADELWAGITEEIG